MKPYGREKKLKGSGEWKTDYHLHEKNKKLLNWWEVILDCLPRATLKRKIRKEVEDEL